MDKAKAEGVDLNMGRRNGPTNLLLGTPLHHACYYGHLETVKRLLSLGAKVASSSPAIALRGYALCEQGRWSGARRGGGQREDACKSE